LMAATQPRKAIAARKHEIRQAMSLIDPKSAQGLMVAWKTGSRWDEIRRAPKEAFIECSDRRVTIDWGWRTKASRLEPNREDMLTVIEGPECSELAATIRTLRKGETLSSLTTTQIRKTLKRVNPVLGAKSIKMGAISSLIDKAAHGLVPLEAVQRLAKHQTLRTTIGYVGSDKRPSLAVALGTGRATRLL